MIFLLLLYSVADLTTRASDFENARIVGTPRLTCSKRTISLFLETNIPFQGRISVIRKMYIPECNQDYSTNIMKNATFKMDIGRCTENTYMTNGSRLLTAHVEIGFHPLVITSSDRVYSVQCIDNSFAILRSPAENTNHNCSHVVRTAAKWEGWTSFHVGDAVVHEWTCAMEPRDTANVQMFLTSCNAISQAGQVIHLVDENGCVVDSELMGDLVYNNYSTKIYARAKIFKLINGERYRIECNLQMCQKGGACRNRPFPPKCAFTKDEIISRYETKLKHIDDALMTGAANPRFDRQVKVSSEWITVLYNEYTNVDQLHERYFLNAQLNPEMVDEPTTPASSHFLMRISYRHPSKKGSEEKSTGKSVATTPIKTSFKPEISPTISSAEDEAIESISETLMTSMPVEQVRFVSEMDEPPLKITTTHSKVTTPIVATATRLTVPKPPPSTRPTSPVGIKSTTTTSKPKITKPPKTQLTTTTTTTMTKKTTPSSTTMNTPFLTEEFERHSAFKLASTEEVKPKKKPQVPVTIVTSVKVPKVSIKGSVATMRFYTDKTMTTEPMKTVDVFSTTAMPFEEDNELFVSQQLKSSADVETSTLETSQGSFSINTKDTFANPRDWRLDDRTINDTDSFSDKQISCGHNTTSIAIQRCIWTGLDHLLVVWSFGSALVWLVMLAVCFYRNSHRKPNWVSYRERELKRTNRARILPQEHPWLHADAFEEPKLKKKHEIDMSKY